MPSKKAIIDELNYLSGLLSERVRTTAAVILAFCWAFIVEGTSSPAGGFLATKEIVPPLLLAVATLLCDFMQYVVGLRLNVKTLRAMEANKLDDLAYDAKEILYVARQSLFYLKMVLLGLALCWLIVIIVLKII